MNIIGVTIFVLLQVACECVYLCEYLDDVSVKSDHGNVWRDVCGVINYEHRRRCQSSTQH